MPNANPSRTPEEEFEKWVSGTDPGWRTLQDAYLAAYRAALERAAEICMRSSLTDTARNCADAILKELK